MWSARAKKSPTARGPASVDRAEMSRNELLAYAADLERRLETVSHQREDLLKELEQCSLEQPGFTW
jgi:hypothetical protein